MISSADLSCPVCLEVFKNPVVLSCSHSFCKACLQDWWTQRDIQDCPVCKRRSSKSDPPSNLVLKNLCESFSQQLTLEQPSVQTAPLCPQHKEKLQLYCVDHQQLVCLVCWDSRVHHRHRFSPIDEMAQEYKKQLVKNLEPLQDNLQKCSVVRQHWDRTSEYIKQQGQNTERQIQRQFDQMRAFLQKEEQVRIRALRSEVEQKSSLMEQRLATLRQQMTALSESISQTERELKEQDVTFLQNYPATVRRVQQVPLKTVLELPFGVLVDVAKHLGNLGFHIWNAIKETVSYTPVVLDPNTAERTLVVSDDLCSVHCIRFVEPTDDPWCPENPERFTDYLTVLASEGLSSGTHCWEVDVESKVDWAVGVIAESMPRRGEIKSGCWDIFFQNGKYIAFSPPSANKILTLKQHLKRIRVNVDMNRREVSFTDSKTNEHIYTFTKVSSNKLIPFINTSNIIPFKVLPVNVTVHV